MGEYNASLDLWYQYFKEDDGPQLVILLAIYGLRLLPITIGFLFNLSIVYLTWMSKNLHGICNILLAMESAFGMILDLGYSISFFVVLSGTKFVRYEHCFMYLIVPCLCGDLAQIVMVFTGIDRVCAVAFPFWYKQRSKKYLLAILACICCFLFYDFIIFYTDYTHTKEIMLSCACNEVGRSSSVGKIMYFKTFIMSAIIIITYSICWYLVCKFAPTSQNVPENNRMLVKALLVIIALNMIGVALKSLINFFFQLFMVVNVFVRTPYSIGFSFLTVIVYSINAPVLYKISTEYRAQFNKHLPWINKLLCQTNSNQVSVITVQPH